MEKNNSTAIVSYWELSEEWQAEADSNLDEYEKDARYLEPSENTTPEKHVLFDLNEAMRVEGFHEGFEYNASIGISNNTAMLLNVSDDGESATFLFV